MQCWMLVAYDINKTIHQVEFHVDSVKGRSKKKKWYERNSHVY